MVDSQQLEFPFPEVNVTIPTEVFHRMNDDYTRLKERYENLRRKSAARKRACRDLGRVLKEEREKFRRRTDADGHAIRYWRGKYDKLVEHQLFSRHNAETETKKHSWFRGLFA